MKKTWRLVAVVVVAASGMSFGVSRWVVSRRQIAVVRVHDGAWLRQELNLTGPQADEIDRLAQEFQGQINALCVTHCAGRFALGDELARATVDPATAQACVEKMNAAQAEAERVTLAHVLNVRALLTDQQARRYSTLVRDQVCSMPMTMAATP